MLQCLALTSMASPLEPEPHLQLPAITADRGLRPCSPLRQVWAPCPWDSLPIRAAAMSSPGALGQSMSCAVKQNRNRILALSAPLSARSRQGAEPLEVISETEEIVFLSFACLLCAYPSMPPCSRHHVFSWSDL
ncbi:hypothetical protein mRhiFer1_008360 [Rhinolophus ferrumequinum]|uniref:Uncharacterized protein n=1 Tax=Rhinolophus ferrumequinum TaxID=59479 RepID=A0A7J7VED2_RHIFE|nr:hypothetical protein mRhiFer1_008360 [Rhinolophus ferrumequinum]